MKCDKRKMKPLRNVRTMSVVIFVSTISVVYFVILHQFNSISTVLSGMIFTPQISTQTWDINMGTRGVFQVHYENNGVKPGTFTILYWTSSYYKGKNWFGEGKEPFSQCTYKNCYATSDRSFYNKSDAVLMLLNYLHGRSLPEYRLHHQKWILHYLEPPSRDCDIGCEKYNGLFNATSSYDTRSDIVTNYSHFGKNVGGYFVRQGDIHGQNLSTNYAGGRDRLVAWFVSHVHTQSKRMAYALRLKQYIPVDIFGDTLPLLSGLRCPRSQDSICFDKLKMHYKFYLSFENSLCRDYVTEKLWSAIYSDVVPIVLGAFNYSELLPPKSYIDIQDFESPKHLANYLMLLDRNDTLYNQYFAWKSLYVIRKLPPPQCSICEYLNHSYNVTKVYKRLDLFWSEKTQCQRPEDFYRHMDSSVWEGVGESIIRKMETVF